MNCPSRFGQVRHLKTSFKTPRLIELVFFAHRPSKGRLKGRPASSLVRASPLTSAPAHPRNRNSRGPVHWCHARRNKRLVPRLTTAAESGEARAFYDVRRDRQYPINGGKYAIKDMTAGNTSVANPIWRATKLVVPLLANQLAIMPPARRSNSAGQVSQSTI
jgi:hypothetical protein